MVKYLLQSNSYIEKERFWKQKHSWLRYWPVSPTVSNSRFEASRGPQPGSLTEPTEASPIVEVSIFGWHVIEWPLRLIFQLILASQNSVQRSSRSVGMRKTFPIHLDLLLFSTCSISWVLGSNILRSSSELVKKFSRRIPLMQRRQLCLNTKNLRSSARWSYLVLFP